MGENNSLPAFDEVFLCSENTTLEEVAMHSFCVSILDLCII